MKQYIRKADIILFILLLIAGLAASAALSLSRSDAGSNAKVVIESGGELFATYSLYEDTELIVPAPGTVSSDPLQDGDGDECTQYENYNVVKISGGRVSVTEASCKNQVCVKHSEISRGGESIVCLPNRLIVRIENVDDKGGGYDSVTS